ncbi:hypothetical protein B0A55_08618 [Friedmanniomyces simplex]|uniref:DNA damage-responsive protein 48 n=1 Tax=Friedmanniomyces simplex TaxID=329884 RepID=A0A4U0WXQ0_9PEZI|nr:hypothetical protein B0A55_08618 [Friedmanniomyces simplex]
MDFVKSLAGENSNNQNSNNAAQGQQQQQSGSGGGGGGFLGGIGDKINSAAGGGPASEKNEGVDMVQEKFLGQGPQNNESAAEQAKDEAISDYIRGQYKNTTGSNLPIKDQPTALDRNAD